MIILKKSILIASYIACGLSFVFFILSFVFSYNQRKDAIKRLDESQVKVYNSIQLSRTEISDVHPLERLVLIGDKQAYDVLFRAYKSSNRMDEAFVFSLVMAYKYSYSQAFYDVFENFNNLYGENSLDSLDAYSRDIALKCLSRAAEMGNVQATREIVKR